VSHFLRRHYERWLNFALRRPKLVWTSALLWLLATGIAFHFVGGEFMPPLEEGNLWVRATFPQDISFEVSTSLADQFRRDLRRFPEVTQVVSQTGRPDDGTDPTTFNNVDIFVGLKPERGWPGHISKERLIEQMQHALEKDPGVSFNFSQNIQDNVEEAMSGLKGRNSLKMSGHDFGTLMNKPNEIADVMAIVQGVEDVGVFKLNGQPNLLITVDRLRAARYAVQPADINAVVQSAIGGSPITQVIEGD